MILLPEKKRTWTLSILRLRKKLRLKKKLLQNNCIKALHRTIIGDAFYTISHAGRLLL